MAISCREVYPTFRLNEKIHIFSKFENMCIKCKPVWGLICVCFEKVMCVETYESKMLLGTS